ncbi:hypothetical protein [Arthrobacter sp. NPDC093139]|uniref:hypothetical protein n=1 Tax=Arthrobacter sp. NPDC093139 TaxID=3363945 RepID=UPI00382B3D1D
MEYVAVLLPSLVVGLLFWFAMKSIFNADKAERQAEAEAQAEADARSAAGTRSAQAAEQAVKQDKPRPGAVSDSQQGNLQAFPPADTSGPSAESDK